MRNKHVDNHCAKNVDAKIKTREEQETNKITKKIEEETLAKMLIKEGAVSRN